MKNNPHMYSEYLLDTVPWGLQEKTQAAPLSQAPSWTKDSRESDVSSKPECIYQLWHCSCVFLAREGRGLVRMVLE